MDLRFSPALRPENEGSAMAVLYLIGAGVADAVVVLLRSAIEVT